jgi:hypothetical protein
MRERGVSFKQALNDAIREGELARAGTRTFSTATADLGMPPVNLDHALRVAADIEDEGFVRNTRVRK